MPFLAAVAALMVMYWNSGKFSLSGAEMSISATFVQLIESMGFALAATAVCGPCIELLPAVGTVGFMPAH